MIRLKRMLDTNEKAEKNDAGQGNPLFGTVELASYSTAYMFEQLILELFKLKLI